ncbi:MAG: sigma factor [Steroidobacteraceae bacterium]
MATERMTGEQDRLVYEALEREQPRLRNWIRRRLANPSDVEDVLQDAFFELVQVDRLLSDIWQQNPIPKRSNSSQEA